MRNKQQNGRQSSGLNKLLLLLILLAGVGAGYFVLTHVQSENRGNTGADTPEAEQIAQYNELVDLWHQNKEINTDYVGELYFDSQLINVSVVKGETNETYLRTDWTTMEEYSSGSVFMDADNTLDDQNLVVYGHYVYSFKDPSRTLMFTPLEQLTKQENYEDNKTLNLLLDGEIRRYEVAAVYYVDLYESEGQWYTNDELNYHIPNFEQDYFNEYRGNVKAVQEYDTGVDFTYSDKLLTLQTCVENHEELREVVICKELERISIVK